MRALCAILSLLVCLFETYSPYNRLWELIYTRRAQPATL
jgi:hypothetical protein